MSLGPHHLYRSAWSDRARRLAYLSETGVLVFGAANNVTATVTFGALSLLLRVAEDMFHDDCGPMSAARRRP